MAAAMQLDLDSAIEWAAQQVEQTEAARGWPESAIASADAALAAAEPGVFERLWTSPQEYYSELAESWSEAGARQGTVPVGWNELGIVWASAGDAAYTAAVEQDLGSVVTLVTDTAAATAADLDQAGEGALGFFSPTKGWLDPSGYKFWIPVVGGAGIFWLWKR